MWRAEVCVGSADLDENGRLSRFYLPGEGWPEVELIPSPLAPVTLAMSDDAEDDRLFVYAGSDLPVMYARAEPGVYRPWLSW